MDDDVARSIAKSLDMLSRVAVLTLIEGRERSDQLRLLAALELKPAEIGAMLGMKANTVAKAIQRLREKAESAE